jgi:hypothetical protein
MSEPQPAPEPRPYEPPAVEDLPDAASAAETATGLVYTVR